MKKNWFLPPSFPEQLLEFAIHFLHAAAPKLHASNTPFLLAVGFMKPHVPFIAPEKWWAFYENLDIDSLRPPTWFRPDGAQHPAAADLNAHLRAHFDAIH